MRRFLHGGFLVTASAVATVSCTLLVSTSDLTGGSAANLGSDACSNGACADVNQPSNESGADVRPTGDAGESDGAALCPSSAIFCDDFESDDLSKWSFPMASGSGEIDTSDSSARHGTKSLRADTAFTDAGVATEAYVQKTFAPVSSGLLAFRAYVYIKDPLKGDQTILKLIATGSDDMNVKLAGTGVLKVDTDTSGSGAEKLGATPAPLGTWFCLEWQATIGTAGHQRLTAGGKVEVDGDEDTFTPNGYNGIQVGLVSADGDREQRIFFDDVVISREPIGCPP